MHVEGFTHGQELDESLITLTQQEGKVQLNHLEQDGEEVLEAVLPVPIRLVPHISDDLDSLLAVLPEGVKLSEDEHHYSSEGLCVFGTLGPDLEVGTL